MPDKRGGFLLADVMVAVTVLALMVGAAGGLLCARRASIERAQHRNLTAECFDESITLMAADQQLSRGVCGGLQWSVERDGERRVWSGSGHRFERTSLALAAR